MKEFQRTVAIKNLVYTANICSLKLLMGTQFNNKCACVLGLHASMYVFMHVYMCMYTCMHIVCNSVCTVILM